MFSGLRSRWQTLCAWQAPTAEMICARAPPPPQPPARAPPPPRLRPPPLRHPFYRPGADLAYDLGGLELGVLVVGGVGVVDLLDGVEEVVLHHRLQHDVHQRPRVEDVEDLHDVVGVGAAEALQLDLLLDRLQVDEPLAGLGVLGGHELLLDALDGLALAAPILRRHQEDLREGPAAEHLILDDGVAIGEPVGGADLLRQLGEIRLRWHAPPGLVEQGKKPAPLYMELSPHQPRAGPPRRDSTGSATLAVIAAAATTFRGRKALAPRLWPGSALSAAAPGWPARGLPRQPSLLLHRCRATLCAGPLLQGTLCSPCGCP